MTIELWSGNIPVDALDIVKERLARVAKRATNKGFPVPSLNVGPSYFEVSPDDGLGIEMAGITITADGPLRLGDYRLIGAVTSLADGTAFVTYAPGGRDWEVEVETPNYCDHCQTIRDRKATYLVRPSVDGVSRGATYQVGSTCVKDFLGHDPSLITAYLDSIESLRFSDDEVSGWSRSATKFYQVDDILDKAARIVAKRGYISKAKAEEDESLMSTGEILRSWLSTARTRLFEDEYPSTDESEALLMATVGEIVRVSDEPDQNEWQADIIRLFGSSGVQWRHVGILGSAVILGLRTQERKVIERKGESEFIGVKGERLDLDVTVDLKSQFEGQFGTSFVIRMTQKGTSNDLLWFASWSEATNALKVGDELSLRGTVKNHELDKRTERPTTVLTRCVLGAVTNE